MLIIGLNIGLIIFASIASAFKHYFIFKDRNAIFAGKKYKGTLLSNGNIYVLFNNGVEYLGGYVSGYC